MNLVNETWKRDVINVGHVNNDDTSEYIFSVYTLKGLLLNRNERSLFK